MNIRIRSIVIAAFLSCLPLTAAVAQSVTAPKPVADMVVVQAQPMASLIELPGELITASVPVKAPEAHPVRKAAVKAASSARTVRLTALEQGGNNSGAGVIRYEF